LAAIFLDAILLHPNCPNKGTGHPICPAMARTIIQFTLSTKLSRMTRIIPTRKSRALYKMANNSSNGSIISEGFHSRFGVGRLGGG
jgi:hypothetical protein